MKKTIVKNVLLVLLTVCALPGLITQTAYAQVLITEIMYDPPGTDKGNEWVELLNDGSTAVNIASIRFFEADTNHMIKESIGSAEIPAGGAAIIAQDSALFKDAYKSYQGSVFISSFSLRQKGGIGELLGIYNTEADRMESQITYVPDERTNGTGASLHLTLGGTQVPAPATPGEIAINPITVTVNKPEEVPEQIEKTDQNATVTEVTTSEMPEKEDIAAIVRDVFGDVDAESAKESSAQENVVVVQKRGADYTIVLWVIAILLMLIVWQLRGGGSGRRANRRPHL